MTPVLARGSRYIHCFLTNQATIQPPTKTHIRNVHAPTESSAPPTRPCPLVQPRARRAAKPEITPPQRASSEAIPGRDVGTAEYFETQFAAAQSGNERPDEQADQEKNHIVIEWMRAVGEILAEVRALLGRDREHAVLHPGHQSCHCATRTDAASCNDEREKHADADKNAGGYGWPTCAEFHEQLLNLPRFPIRRGLYISLL